MKFSIKGYTVEDLIETMQIVKSLEDGDFNLSSSDLVFAQCVIDAMLDYFNHFNDVIEEELY